LSFSSIIIDFLSCFRVKRFHKINSFIKENNVEFFCHSFFLCKDKCFLNKKQLKYITDCREWYGPDLKAVHVSVAVLSAVYRICLRMDMAPGGICDELPK